MYRKETMVNMYRKETVVNMYRKETVCGKYVQKGNCGKYVQKGNYGKYVQKGNYGKYVQKEKVRNPDRSREWEHFISVSQCDSKHSWEATISLVFNLCYVMIIFDRMFFVYVLTLF